MDVNRAGYDELIRVPGIGPISTRKIIDARREQSFFSAGQLKKMGVVTKRVAPFIWFKGMSLPKRQMSFLPQLNGKSAPFLAGSIE